MPRKTPLVYQPSDRLPGWTSLLFKGEYVGIIRDSHTARQGEKDEQIEVYDEHELIAIIWVQSLDSTARNGE